MNTEELLSLINPLVRSLGAYHLTPDNAPVKLNQNENPFDWPDEIKEKAAAYCRARPWNRYPDFIPRELRETLAAYVGVGSENIIAGNGSNEMLLVLLLSLASPSRPVIVCQPTFTVYRLLSGAMECRGLDVFLDDRLRFDTERLIDACRKNPGAVCIFCSPNNPTGSALSHEQIVTVLENHHGFVILDQAYVEFGGYNAVALCQHYPQLIITRTFSKALGAAGLRMGYMIGAAEVISQINKVKLPYNVNFFSLFVASMLLRNKSVLDKNIALLTSERERLFGFLQSAPFENVYESEANFILVRSAHKDRLRAFMRDGGVLVRDVSAYPMLENCLRISVDAPKENDLCMERMDAFFKK